MKPPNPQSLITLVTLKRQCGPGPWLSSHCKYHLRFKKEDCSEGSGFYVELSSPDGNLAVFANSESLIPQKARGPLE